MCSRVHVPRTLCVVAPHVLTCSSVLSNSCNMCSYTLCALVAHVPRALRALVLYLPHIESVLVSLVTHSPLVPHAQHTLML